MESKVFNRVLFGILLILTLANMVLLGVLLNVRRQVAGAAVQAASMLQQVQEQSLATPFTVNVRIDDTFTVPLDIAVPINTTVRVPVVLPILGQSVTVTVPINTSVPIHTTVRIPIKTSVPVQIKISDLPIGTLVQQVQDWLRTLADPLHL